MEFYIGAEFSREFTFEESRITHKLADELNVVFKGKEYGDRIKELNISAICVSKDFEAFCVVRPPKVSRKEPVIVYELKLDYDTFKPLEEKGRKHVLVNEIFNVTQDVLGNKTINGFEKEKFLKDLEAYFIEQGYLKAKA